MTDGLSNTAPALDRAEWLLDPRFTFLNHGSFGAAPRSVLAVQDGWRRHMETHPGEFFARLPVLLRDTADGLASFLGGMGRDYAFVDNASAGCNAVLASLHLAPGDEILITDHVYPAVAMAVAHFTTGTGTRVIEAKVPFPVARSSEIVDAVAPALSSRTRLAIFDHITSDTAVIFPVRELTKLAHNVGAEVLIDGAHAPGMLDLNIPSIGADYYVGNCHKWLMGPKGSAFLWAAPSAQGMLHPLVISHGYGQGFTEEFDWTGTRDPSAWLTIPAAIALHLKIGDGTLRQRNIGLAREASDLLSTMLGSVRGTSDALTGSMATVRLPFDGAATRSEAQRLRDAINARHQIDVAVTPFADSLWLRVSAQAYNVIDDYRLLAEAVINWP
jgi:isopenicillin-N epimerase